MAKKVTQQEAVDGLVAILTDAQEDEPRLVPFIQGLWELAVKKGAKWMPERLPIHTSEWRKIKKAMTTIGGRKGYIIYRDWMMSHRYRRRPLLELVEKGGSPVVAFDPRSGVPTTRQKVGLWRVNLPVCDGNPWKDVLARLPKPTEAPGLNLRQVAVIRECIASASPHRMASRLRARPAQMVETARMAACHALLKSGSRKASVCPFWPSKEGVDLAVWFRTPGRKARILDWHPTRTPDLLIVVGKGDGRYGDVVRRFDRADGEGKAARVYLSVRKPKEQFRQKRRLSVRAYDIRIIRVAGVADHGLSYRAPKVQD